MADPNEWLPMASAPKDGTEIELLMHHPNRKFAEGSEQDQWTQIVRAKWIDFNHGGWTWSGMYGNPQGWRPIATAAAHGDCWSAFPGVCGPECVCPGGERDPARGVNASAEAERYASIPAVIVGGEVVPDVVPPTAASVPHDAERRAC